MSLLRFGNEAGKSLSDAPFAALVADGVAAEFERPERAKDGVLRELCPLDDAVDLYGFERGAFESFENGEALGQGFDLVGSFWFSGRHGHLVFGLWFIRRRQNVPNI